MTKIIISRIPQLRVQMSVTEESIKWFLEKKKKMGLSYHHQVTWKCSEVSLGMKLQFWKNDKIPPAEVFQMSANQNIVKIAGNRYWA